MNATRRVAALFDIHGNLPALDAVLDEARGVGVERLVVGGDVIPGPMPRETLDRLLGLDLPVQFIHGNCERSVLAQMGALRGDAVTYWGTTSGGPLREPDLTVMRWTAEHLYPKYEPILAGWPPTRRMEIEGLGTVLFCHGTPRSETEIVLRTTPEDRLRSLYDGVGADVVVCGHTHMQFDRTIGAIRVVNAGSIGMPFGDPGAYWALLGPGLELRCTPYDRIAAAERFRRTTAPQADEDARRILEPLPEGEMLAMFSQAEVGASGP